MRVHIVTDSSAQFNHPQVAAQYPITIVPNTLVIAGQHHKEYDIPAEKVLELITRQDVPPRVIAPTVEDYAAVYTRLAYHHGGIISIHASRELSDSYAHAQTAAKQLDGHVQVHVIDSRTLDAAQGMIVRAAARAAENDISDMDDMVRQVRATADRAYALYVTPTTDYLVHAGVLTAEHAVLNAMHKTMPLLALEDGVIVPTEKVRSYTQAVDRFLEFVTEFEAIEDGLILQPRAFMNEHTRNLQDRLTQEFPGKHFPHTIYGASLACLIGADATGLAVLECDPDGTDADVDAEFDDNDVD